MSKAIVGIDASRALVPNPTGTEEYSRRIIEHLLRLESGVRFRLYARANPFGCCPNPPLAAVDEAFREVEWRIIPFPRLWTHARLSWEMALHRPDALFVPAHVIPVIHPGNSFATIHDLGYLKFPDAHPFSQRLYLDLSTRWNLAVSRKVFAVSKTTKIDLVKHYGADERKIEVIYPGANREIGRVSRAKRIPVLKKYGLEDDNYVLYVGTIQPRKNLKRLMEAFARMRGRKGLKLVIAGKIGWKSEGILRSAKELGLSEAVVFTDYIPEEEKFALLSGALVFAFVSLYEGFGFPVLEAQASGTPVLASNTSSLPEVAGDGALLVNPSSVEEIADGLRMLSEDRMLREELKAKGKENLKRFSWDEAAKKILGSILDSLYSTEVA